MRQYSRKHQYRTRLYTQEKVVSLIFSLKSQTIVLKINFAAADVYSSSTLGSGWGSESTKYI